MISTERQIIRLALSNQAWDSPRGMSPFQAVFRLLYICKDLLSEVLDPLPIDGPLPGLHGRRDFVPAQTTCVLPRIQRNFEPLQRQVETWRRRRSPMTRRS